MEEGSAYMSITCRSVHTYPKTDDNNKGELKTIVKSQILLDLLSYQKCDPPLLLYIQTY